jgi:hypothetical protein
MPPPESDPFLALTARWPERLHRPPSLEDERPDNGPTVVSSRRSTMTSGHSEVVTAIAAARAALVRASRPSRAAARERAQAPVCASRILRT